MNQQFNVVEFVEQQQDLFLPKVMDNSVNWESEKQFAIQLFQANDYLAKVARSNPISAQNAIINVAAIGITLNPAQKLAYLVPRNGGVCLDISYMGLMHLAADTGSIRWGQAVIVHANDTFKRIGIDKAPIHEVDEFGDRGDPVGAYCVVKTSDGDYLTDVMKRDDILAIRDRSVAWKAWVSKKKSCPWVTDELEMWRKTVVKRASKYWPKVERLNNAIEYLNNQGEGFEKEPVIPHYSQEQIEALEAKSKEAFADEIQEHCDHMDLAESMNSLKSEFQVAYKKTAGHKLQDSVQTTYAKNKARLENDSTIQNS